MRRTRATTAIAAIVIIFAATACSSSSKSSNDPSSSGTTAACPFSGALTAQSEPSATAGAAKLESVKPSRSGCIDNLALSFSPSLAASTAAYNGATPVLVVKLANTTYAAATPINTTNLEYVKSLTVAAAGTATEVTITLDQQRPFDLSSSNVPAALQISIG